MAYFAKPTPLKYATSKCATASKGGFASLVHDRAAIRMLLANIGGVAIMAAITSFRPSDASDFTHEFVLMIVGVAVYLVHARNQKSKVKAPKIARGNRASAPVVNGKERELWVTRSEPPPKPHVRVRQAPTFTTIGWDAEINEFLQEVVPTDNNDPILLTLANAVRTGVRQIVPEAKVTSFATINLVSNNDCGSLEADVVIELEPRMLAERMEAFGLKKLDQRPENDHQIAERKCALTLEPDALAKMTLRTLTRELASQGFFLYHHCTYKEQEPKVVLRVPASRGLTDRDMFVSFTVNCPTPVRQATMTQQLKVVDHKALEVGLLVRRWARDRGIAYSAKGHLSPYAWTCLVGFYLQQRHGDATEKPMFGLDHKQPECADEASGTVGAMFKGFLRFYANFDWKAGVISMRLGRQVAWSDSSLRHSVEEDRVVGIEDPFGPTRNIAESITSAGFKRLREELTRASDLVGTDSNSDDCARFIQLLEAWTAPNDPVVDVCGRVRVTHTVRA